MFDTVDYRNNKKLLLESSFSPIRRDIESSFAKLEVDP